MAFNYNLNAIAQRRRKLKAVGAAVSNINIHKIRGKNDFLQIILMH